MDKQLTTILISVDDDHLLPDQMESVVGKLKEKGVHVKDWDDMGIITASVDADQDLGKLRTVDGVRHVRPQHTFQLPPRRSKVQ